MQLEPFILQEKTLGQVLDATVARSPDSPAIIHSDRGFRQSWREFDQSVDDLARGLMALGVQKGEKIGVWATNVPHWITLMFASARIGAVLLTVNTSYRDSELAYLLLHSDCENLFMTGSYRDHDFVGILHSVAPEARNARRESFGVAKLPCLRRLVMLCDTPHPAAYGLSEIMALASQVSDVDYTARKASIAPHDVVNMQYTSGTTGFPKGVMLTHCNIVNNGYWIGRHQNFSPADTICLPVPLFHCFGCVLGVMAAVNHGAAMAVIDAFNPVQVLQTLEKERCTGLYGVPSMFLAILEHRSFARHDLSSLRTGIMAGSVCPAPLMRRVIRDMHMSEITICYGLTEGSPVLTQTHADEEFERRVTTVGRAMPGIEVRVADPHSLEEKPRGEAGEVICRGYNVMKGYYKMPEETAAVIDKGWLHTGDLGIMDEDGYMVITGRIKDMIIRGGENIYPREIEEFLSGMETVVDVQVVGVPSRKYGEEVAAFIIPREGCALTVKEVRSWCRGRIAWHKVPRHIAFVESYPLTGSGKVQKYKLREMAAELFHDAANR